MRALSAPDAISPAIERTRNFLFRPFQWGTYLKLGLVAMVTEGFLNSSRSSGHGGYSPDHMPSHSLGFHLSPVAIAAIVAAVLLAIVISLFVFYLVTRLRFAYFHCLVQNTRYIRPGWRIYRNQASRFFWFNLAVGIAYLLLAALLIFPFAAGIVQLIRATSPGGQPDIGPLLALVLPLIPLVLLLILVAFLIDVALRDWMLPHFALDNATPGQAWAQVWAHVTAEKLQFFVYTLLRVILPTIAFIVLFLLLMIPGLFAVGATAMFGYGVHGALAGATGASLITKIALEVFFGILAFGIVLFASICVAGPVCTAIREYALLFYGGRYRTLGNLLDPPAPQSPNLGASQPA
jgi:MFS family permease